MLKVIIAGSRGFNDYEYLKMRVNALRKNTYGEFTILSGHATGADLLGERYANEHGLRLETYPAKWDLYGKSAGTVRNLQMAKVSDILIAFWDSKSKGTKNMITCALDNDLEVHVIRV